MIESSANQENVVGKLRPKTMIEAGGFTHLLRGVGFSAALGGLSSPEGGMEHLR